MHWFLMSQDYQQSKPILGLHPANKKRRYKVKLSLIVVAKT